MQLWRICSLISVVLQAPLYEAATQSPTKSPTKNPSKSPTKSPTRVPTKPGMTFTPSKPPTKNPTENPTKSPSKAPTKTGQTWMPSKPPTKNPTENPTKNPTGPTSSPTKSPTKNPTKAPSKSPTSSPRRPPTNLPITMSPTTPALGTTPTATPVILLTQGRYVVTNRNILDMNTRQVIRQGWTGQVSQVNANGACIKFAMNMGSASDCVMVATSDFRYLDVMSMVPQTPPPPMYPVVDTNTALIRLTRTGTVSSFNKQAMIDALKAISALSTSRSRDQVTDVLVHWVCPSAACPTVNGVPTCDTLDTDRIAKGCRRGYEYPDTDRRRRSAHILQDSMSYVDVSVVPAITTPPFSTNPQATATESARIDYTNALQNANAPLRILGVTAVTPANGWTESVPGATNAPGTWMSGGNTMTPTTQAFGLLAMEEAENEDDQLASWQIALLVLVIIVCILLVILVALFFMYNKKDKKPRENEQDMKSKGSDPSAVSPGESRPLQQYPPPPQHPDAPVAGQMGQGEFQQREFDPVQKPGNFLPGDRVAAYFEGSEHTGEVASRQENGTYSINWDDGTHSVGVDPQLMRRLPPAGTYGGDPTSVSRQSYYTGDDLVTYAAGDRVEALYGDSYHPGEVVAKQENGFYTVNWDDGSHSVDVPPDTMRVRNYVD